MAEARKPIERPKIACEIGATRLTAARAGLRNELELYTSRHTPAKAVQPSVLANNVEDVSALSAELQSALEAVSGKHRDVGLVVPDASVRVNILDFDQLPADDEEARAVVRLRFRRNVPFEAEDSSVSFQRLASRAGAEVRVLAVAMPRIALEGYERTVREAGYTPGLVLPSTLAALGAVDTSTPCMVVRHFPAAESSGNYSTTIVIAAQDDLLLYRSIEGTAADSAGSVLDDVYSSMVFYEDNFGAKLPTVYMDGASVTPEAAESFRSYCGATLREFPQRTAGQNLSGETLPPGALAPLAGVLLG